jgi:polyisoprenoid-binding protein YceI
VRRWRATFIVDLAQPRRSSIDVVIDASSVETGAADRDNHARSADFLDVARFPEIQFRSRQVHAERGGRRLTIVGDLKIRDVVREISVVVERKLAASMAAAGAKLAFHGHTTISRRDFGLRWYHERDGGGAFGAGDKVDIEFDINARRGVK